MNFVYLSPHFPPNFTLFARRLSELGVNVLGLGDAPYEQLGGRLQQALTDYYRVGDLHHHEELARALDWLSQRHGRLDRLDSHAEYWLETEARLRTDFNIPGLQNDVIASMKSKSQMKEIFHQAGVAVAPGRVVEDLEQAEQFFRELGKPVVAKPDVGVGAAGTYKLESIEQLRKFYAERPRPGYFLEEFIEGELYSFDGLVDRDGQLVFATAHHFNQGIMETVNLNDHMFYYSLREVPADLEAAGRRLLKAYDLRERFFHFEFFRTRAEGKIVALEVNMRPPGGLTTDLFNYANDIDIYREWANVVVHNRFEARWTRPYHGCYVGRKDWKSYRHSRSAIQARLGSRLVHWERIQPVFAGAIGDEGFILRSPDLEEVLCAARFILDTH